ncbi:MAG: ABC transporter substrate-binding protein [Chloroflexi bacterium]|nr:ABC transporter substrate-binding protein [Chloroflexota bacterium]
MAWAILLSACSPAATPTPRVLPTSAQPTAVAQVPPPPGFGSWQDVLKQARGTTVNWYMWGGSAVINEFVDTFYGDVLREEFGITLRRVPVADTADAVNLVISETQAGITDRGAVDMIWINGQNFFTLRQANLLYGPWAENIPNSLLVDWDDPAVAFDFGFPVDGFESPWSSAQFHFIYDSARMSESELPRSYDELDAWIRAHPDRFTYIAPGPGAFQGTRFVKQALYWTSGGYEQWVGEWNQALYDVKSPALWEKLNSWKPFLWRKGETYPANENELHQLFANGEVDFTITQASAGAGPAIAAGLIPESSRAFAFREYLIGDYNYVAIPANASHKAAALVLADLILRPDRQAGHILPESGFGLGYAIDLDRVNATDRALLEQSLGQLGPATADAAMLAQAFAPDMAPQSQSAIERDWEANVLRK